VGNGVCRCGCGFMGNLKRCAIAEDEIEIIKNDVSKTEK